MFALLIPLVLQLAPQLAGMIFGSKDVMEARRFAHQHPRGAGLMAGAPTGTVKP